MAAWIGPAISAGASLLGGVFGKKKTGPQQAWNIQGQQNWREMFDQQKYQFDTQRKDLKSGISDRVADARRAGLHPLFALGGNISAASPTISAGNISPAFPGQHETGSGIGTAITAAGRTAAAAYSQRHAEKQRRSDPLYLAQVRAANAQALRNEAEAMAADSARKRAEQQAIAARVPKVETFPLPVRGKMSPWSPLGKKGIREAKHGKLSETVPVSVPYEGPFGLDWRTRRRSPPAALEEIYGDVEPLTWTAGIAQAFEDFLYNNDRWAIKHAFGKRSIK